MYRFIYIIGGIMKKLKHFMKKYENCEFDEKTQKGKVFCGNYVGLLNVRDDLATCGLLEIRCNCYQNEFEVEFAL